MRKTLIGLSSVAIVFTLAAVPAFATKPTKPTSVGKPAVAKGGQKTKPTSIKGAAPKGVGKASSPKAKAPTAKPAKGTNPAAAKGTNPGAAKGTKAVATNTESTGSTAPVYGPGPWIPNNPVAQKLSTKSNLLARIKNSLPPGADLNLATVGFKNFGQFVAATNVSSNLGIDFWQLKASMTGLNATGLSTGQPTLSLGQSIQKLKPGTNGTVEAQRAQTLADDMIIQSGN